MKFILGEQELFAFRSRVGCTPVIQAYGEVPRKHDKWVLLKENP